MEGVTLDRHICDAWRETESKGRNVGEGGKWKKKFFSVVPGFQ